MLKNSYLIYVLLKKKSIFLVIFYNILRNFIKKNKN